MSIGDKIEFGKKTLGRLLTDFWFLIPEYQRPYVWTPDNVNDLLEDLWYAYENSPENEYFMGSLVLKRNSESSFPEYEVLDGQQRLTTFILLLTVLRSVTTDERLKKSIENKLFQEENEFDGIPERQRIVYKIRGDADTFLKNYIQSGNRESDVMDDLSVKNIIKAIETIENFLNAKSDLEEFAKFLFQNVVFIYVATEDRKDAFRLFTILNNRGIPLTNADILKAVNIGEVEEHEGREIAGEYAKKWESIQNDLGENFDRFLGFIRTILVKEKARKGLLEEFEEKIYKKGILSKGKQTVDLIEEYYKVYEKIIDFSVDDTPLPGKGSIENNEYKNLIAIMKAGLPSTDWIPPLLHFYRKFGSDFLLEFLKKLEFKFSGDWILYFTPTQRIENMNKILKKIESAKFPEEVLNDQEIFKVDVDELRRALARDVYGKRFVKYVLLRYEFLVQDNSNFIGGYSRISVEHILPQNPPKESKWREWFTDEEIEEYKHKLGNLVLLNRKKNSSLSNLDFEKKKEKYLRGSKSTFTSINNIMEKDEWRKENIEERTNDMIEKLTAIP